MMNDERATLNELIETYALDVQQGSLADRQASSRALDDSLDRIIAERDAARGAYALKAEMWSIAVADLGAAREALRKCEPFIAKAYREGGIPTFPNAADLLEEVGRALASLPERPSYTDGAGTFVHSAGCALNVNARHGCTCWPPERPSKPRHAATCPAIDGWECDCGHQGEQEKS